MASLELREVIVVEGTGFYQEQYYNLKGTLGMITYGQTTSTQSSGDKPTTELGG